MAHVNIKETHGNDSISSQRPPVAGIPFRVLFDFTAASDNEVSLREGDVVEVFDRSSPWWTISRNGKRGFAPNISLEPISGSVDVVSPEDNDIPVEIPHNIPENQDSSPISPSGTSNLAIPKSPITPSSKPVLPKLVVPDSTPRSNISTPISAASSHTSVGFSTLEDQSSSPGVSPIVDNSVRVLPTKVRALCDVTGTEPGELSFKKGDIIEVDVRTSAEIWHGKVNDTSGTFQLNFSVEPILKERVRALWDFVSAAPEDLSFKSGDIIQVYGPSSSSTWWWHGLIQGKGIGTFPYNFVEPLEDEFADSEDEGADIVKSSIPKTLARFRVLKDVVAIEEGMLNLKRGDILELVSKQSHEKWLGRSRSQTGTFFLDENIEPIMTNKVKALYDFTSSNPGELTFKANDIITVVGPSDDFNTFWWYGTVQEKLGIFPYNFVELIPDERDSDSDDDWVDISSSKHPETPQDVSPKPTESIRPQMIFSDSKPTSSPIEQPQEPRVSYQPHEKPRDLVETIESSKVLAKAIQGHVSDHPQSLCFAQGDVIEVLAMPTSSRWWKGMLGSKTGYFPSTLVEKLPDQGSYIRSSLDILPVYTSEDRHSRPAKHSRTATDSVLFNSPVSTSKITPLSPLKPPTPSPSSSPSRIYPPTTRFARALYDFKAERDGDLSFLCGDVIELVETPDDHWWKGKLRNTTGLIPSNYVHIIDSGLSSEKMNTASENERKGPNRENQNHNPAPLSTGDSTQIQQPVEWVRARHRYKPQNRKEIGFETGDLIQVTQKLYQYWWVGRLQRNGTTIEGLFPLNYVEVLSQPVPHSPQDILSTPSPIADPRRKSSFRLEDDEAVRMLRFNVAKLFPLLKKFDIERDLAEDVEIQDLFRNTCILRRRVVRLLKDEPFSDELLQIDASFHEVKKYYDLVMQLCANRHIRQEANRITHLVPPQERLTGSSVQSTTPIFLTGSGSSGYTIVSEPSSYATGTAMVTSSTTVMMSNPIKRQSTEGSIRMDLPRAPSGDNSALKSFRLSQTMSVADPTSAATRIQSSLQTVERRFDGRISAIEEDIARACEAYRHRDSRDRSQMQVEENTRKLPSSPAVKIFKRAVRGVRKESTTRLASLTSNPAHNKTIYKKEVEYQYLHIVHGDQGPRPSKSGRPVGR